MTDPDRPGLNLLRTGIPGFDEILGGGVPEYSFNLVAGPPGSGKTTLVHQLAFANGTPERPALYFIVMGEPPLKMLRYQRLMEFFRPEAVGTAVRFVDLSQEVMSVDPDRLLELIAAHIETANPSVVAIDSHQAFVRSRTTQERELFLHRLALHLMSWQTTSFLVGEYAPATPDPLFTMADGIVWLTQTKERHSVVRHLEVVKLRGLEGMAGLHTFRISSHGIQVFSRNPPLPAPRVRRPGGPRLSTGVPGLDPLMGGGIPDGDVTLVAGPSGTGKTALCTHFIAEGVKLGQPGVLALFEEKPDEYLARAIEMGFDLDSMVRSGALKIVHLRAPDLSADEIIYLIRDAALKQSAKRLVVDSLNGLELSMAPNYREDFREALYRLVGGLSSAGATVALTVEVTESFDQIRFSPHAVSFMAQNIVFMRYSEIGGRLRKVLAVVKMRRSAHTDQLFAYEITGDGMRILGRLKGYVGILTGSPTPTRAHRR